MENSKIPSGELRKYKSCIDPSEAQSPQREPIIPYQHAGKSDPILHTISKNSDKYYKEVNSLEVDQFDPSFGDSKKTKSLSNDPDSLSSDNMSTTGKTGGKEIAQKEENLKVELIRSYGLNDEQEDWADINYGLE
jgi:hypothetical protein